MISPWSQTSGLSPWAMSQYMSVMTFAQETAQAVVVAPNRTPLVRWSLCGCASHPKQSPHQLNCLGIAVRSLGLGAPGLASWRVVLVALDRDRLGDGPVEVASTSRTNHLQGDRPKLVVTEIVREPLIADDPSTPQFVDMINKLVLWLRP